MMADPKAALIKLDPQAASLANKEPATVQSMQKLDDSTADTLAANMQDEKNYMLQKQVDKIDE